MATRTWLLLNAALLVLAGISTKALFDTPSKIRQQQKLTQQAISPKLKTPAKPASKAILANRKSSKETDDTWPAIRRGSLSNIWKMTLFSPQRSEELMGQTELDKANAAKEEELPAPPNFELIGILTANKAKVAIIELKTPSRKLRYPSRYHGRQNGEKGSTQTGTPGKQSFVPTFVTAHEKAPLGDTGFTVLSILREENAVVLTKDGFNYRLALDRNGTQATQRKESQLSYAKSVNERIKANEAKLNSARQEQRANQSSGSNQGTNTPQAPGRARNYSDQQLRPATSQRYRGNVPVNAPHYFKNQSNHRDGTHQQRLIPANQR